MSSAMVSRVLSHFRDRRRVLSIAILLVVFFIATHDRPFITIMDLNQGLPPAAEPSAESYALPVSPPLDQGDSDLCWVYAALSMLESNYIHDHPGSHIVLSRGAVQFDSIADRFARIIRGDPGAHPEDGGLAVEALALIRQNGVLAQSDFHDAVDSDDITASIEDRFAHAASPDDKRKALDEELKASLGAKPHTTHLDGKAVTPEELASAVLGGRQFFEFDLARDGVERWGPSQDPEARPETRVRYVPLDILIDLIHQSLAGGRAVVWGSTDHALLIYGGDYDKEGKPLSYLIKDSLAPYTYRRSAEEVHRILNDVTVSLDDGPADKDGTAAASQAKRSRPPAQALHLASPW